MDSHNVDSGARTAEKERLGAGACGTSSCEDELLLVSDAIADLPMRIEDEGWVIVFFVIQRGYYLLSCITYPRKVTL